MANYESLKTAIRNAVYENGNNEITGQGLQDVLEAIVNSLGAGYQFASVATTETEPGTPDTNVMYIAGAGTYPNFGGTVVPRGSVGVFRYNGEWIYSIIDVASWADASNKLYYNTQAGNVAAKTIQADGFTLQPGGWIKIHFDNANTVDNPTLNVNNTGAHTMTFNGRTVSETNSWKAGETVAFYYDNYGVGIWRGIRLVEYPDFINVNELVGQTTPFTSASAARSAIPQQNRKAGLNITYLLSTGENTSQWVQDMFIGDDVTDWGVADNWKVVGLVSVSQNSQTGHTDITVGGDTTPVASVKEVSQLGQQIGNKYNLESITMTTGGYIQDNGTTVDITDIHTHASFKYAVVNCQQGDVFLISGVGASAARLWCFIDADSNKVDVALEYVSADGLVKIAPATAAKLIINSNISSNGVSYKGKNISVFTDEVETAMLMSVGLFGEKLSIIGSSISSINENGYKYDSYVTYYPNAGIDRHEKMYWGLLMKMTNLKMEINASYGGSGATKRDSAPFIPSFYDRVSLLGLPDTIIVELGTNDSIQHVEIGDIDYDAEIASLSETLFAPAYLKGIKGLLAAYPNAKIVCLILEMEEDYANIIREISAHYNLMCVDARGYTSGKDGQGHNLAPHPGVLGMKEICSSIMDTSHICRIENKINKEIDTYAGIRKMPVSASNYIVTNGTTVDITTLAGGNTWRHYVMDCQEGDMFQVTGKAGSSPRVWCFTDSSYNVLSVAPDGITCNNAIIYAPANAAKLICNFQAAYEYALYKGAFANIEEKAQNNSFKNLVSDINGFAPITWENGTFNVNYGTEVSSQKEIRSNVLPSITEIVRCNPNYRIKAYFWDVNGSYVGVWNGNGISHSAATSIEYNICKMVGRNNYKVRIVLTKSDPTIDISTSEGSNVSFVSEIQSEMERNGAWSILPPLDKPSTTISEITYHSEDGLVSLNGSASAQGAILFENPSPANLVAGDKLHCFLSDTAYTGLFLQIINNGETIVSTQTEQDFIVPETISNMTIRLYFNSNLRCGNRISVRPTISKVMTNRQIENKLSRVIPVEFSPMLTIIDDDGNTKFYTDVLPIIQSEHVPISSAVPVGTVGTTGAMTWEQIEECYRNGAEILSHAYHHVTSYDAGMSEFDVENDFMKAKNGLLSRGFYGGRYHVYTGSTGEDSRAKTAAPYVFDLAINSAGNVMNFAETINKYRIHRYRIQTDSYQYDLDALKALIDECYASNGWMVWMFHTSDITWTETAKQNLIAAIQYAKTKGLPIVNLDYVYRKYLKNM